MSLNVDKTGMIIFRLKDKDITKKKHNIKIIGQQICTSKQMTYLDTLIDESPTWSAHITMLKANYSRANGVLVKFRYYHMALHLK